MIFRALKYEKLFQLAAAVDEHIGEDECVYTTMADIVSLYSRRKTEVLPLDMYDNAESGYGYDINRLDRCDYVLMIGMLAVPVREYVSMYPINALNNHLAPILLSNLNHNGRKQTAAAFAEILGRQAPDP